MRVASKAEEVSNFMSELEVTCFGAMQRRVAALQIYRIATCFVFVLIRETCDLTSSTRLLRRRLFVV